MVYFASLLAANLMQAVGTSLNAKWVVDRTVESGAYCTVQAGLKQAGNVGMALWYTLSLLLFVTSCLAHACHVVPLARSFALSLHVFMLLFVRRLTISALHCWVHLAAGWFLVAFDVAIGPTAIETAARGPYFGPTGYW